MADVYATFLEIQDENRSRNEQKYLSAIEKLEKKNPADFKVQKAKLDVAWETEKRKDIYAREHCNIDTTIPPKAGRPSKYGLGFKGKYREMMRTSFRHKIYGQRWQVETVFSMIKRKYGSALRARNIESQAVVPVMNIMNVGIFGHY